jgi:hypothetical protein
MDRCGYSHVDRLLLVQVTYAKNFKALFRKLATGGPDSNQGKVLKALAQICDGKQWPDQSWAVLTGTCLSRRPPSPPLMLLFTHDLAAKLTFEEELVVQEEQRMG